MEECALPDQLQVEQDLVQVIRRPLRRRVSSTTSSLDEASLMQVADDPGISSRTMDLLRGRLRRLR